MLYTGSYFRGYGNYMKTIINELLQQDLSRRQVIVNTTKISAAVAASSTLTAVTLNAADTTSATGKEELKP